MESDSGSECSVIDLTVSSDDEVVVLTKTSRESSPEPETKRR